MDKKPIDKMGRIMTPEQQVDLWLKGELVHNGRSRADGECLPDFSCCRPELAWPMEERIAFKKASGAERETMMVGGLTGLADSEGVDVKVIK